MKLLSSFYGGIKTKEQFLGLGLKRQTRQLLRENLGNYWGELSMDYYTCYTKDKDRPNQNLYNCRNATLIVARCGDDNGTGGALNS
jgi:hypothetical protein